VAGVMVSIAAFQAVDTGSIPGLRTVLQCEAYLAWLHVVSEESTAHSRE
jgi:hypothetical protein